MLKEHVGPLRLSRGDPQRQVKSYLEQRRVILAAMGVLYFTDVVLTVFVLLAYPGVFSESNRVSAGIISAAGVLTWAAFKAILYAVVIANLVLLYVAVCRTADGAARRESTIQVYLLAELVLLGTLHIFYGLILVHNLVTVARGLGT
jgi:hypothetical protein